MQSSLRWWPACLALTLTAFGPARAQAPAQDLRFEAGEHLYALSELLAGGEPLYQELFKNGWPTDRLHRRLTRELDADALVASYLGSGAGLPLSATSYQDARAQRAKQPGLTAALLLRQELTIYKNLTGATFNIPPQFDPVAIPYHRARAELNQAYSKNDLASLRWKATTTPRHSLDALGFALLVEARYARQQLLRRHEAQVDGKPVQQWGATAEGGFFGFVALHSAVAKLHELRRLVVDANAQEFSAKPSLGLPPLDEFRYFFPTGWTTSPRAGGPDHFLIDGPDKLKSHLFGLSAVLLGACEVLTLTDAEGGPRELQGLFSDRPLPGTSAPLFEKDTVDVALDVALFAFKSLRSMHVNVTQARATSLGGLNVRGTTITPTDLGAFLLALEAFRVEVQLTYRGADRHPRYAEIQEEQRKADTLLRSLANASLLAWDADEPGMYDLYTIANNSRQGQTKSLASQALAVRGFLATHRHIAPAGESSPMLAAAERTLRWLDRERWDQKAQGYVEKTGDTAKAPAMAAVALLGALRDMALTTGDGRYLTRHMQYLESLVDRGLIRPAADRSASGFTPEVAFPK